MIKLGVILLAYENEEGLYDKIAPFQRDNIVISAVHAVFPQYHEAGYPILSKDGTHNKLKEFKERGLIKYFNMYPCPEEEWNVRTKALNVLEDNEKCTYYLILDGDEQYSDKDVSGLLKFIEQNLDIAWFSIQMKNLIFDKNHYLDNFSPPRIFQSKFYNGSTIFIDKFYWDNDVEFLGSQGERIDYKSLPTKKIPRNLCFPFHDTWRSIPRSKDKINYQMNRFKTCSYIWDEEKGLQFNLNYFKQTNQPIPEIYTND